MPDRKERVIVVDSDLEGSCGLHHIRKAFPEVYVHGGIMERNNFSVAAGFGATAGKQGIFATFSAFLEMVISEITMARLNQANVLAHFSHAGVDDMADNTCHFGINIFFADNGLLENDATRLYYPADSLQLKAVLSSIFFDKGLRFVFSTRSGTPFILKADGQRFYGEGYTFIPGKDDLIREGSDGYIVTYGEMLYRCLDIVEDLKTQGLSIGLVNKTTLNLIDEDMLKLIGAGKAVLTVETQNVKNRPWVPNGNLASGKGLSSPIRLHGNLQGRLRRSLRADPESGNVFGYHQIPDNRVAAISGRGSWLLQGLPAASLPGNQRYPHFWKMPAPSLWMRIKSPAKWFRKDRPAWREIVGAFGRSILLPDGEINRILLGDIIFNDPAQKQVLNRIVHPDVISETATRLAEIEKNQPGAVVILDVPLLIESGMDTGLSDIIVVYVPEPVQIQRLMIRDALTQAQALARIRSQMPIEEKKKRATIVIDNSGSRENTRIISLRVYQKLCDKK